MNAVPAFELLVSRAGARGEGLLRDLDAVARAWLHRDFHWRRVDDAPAGDRRRLLAEADALLCLARDEDDGTLAWVRDALAVGCPVIATAGEPVEELLGPAGLILAEERPEAVGGALHAIDEVPELRRRLLASQRCRARELGLAADAEAAIAIAGPNTGSYSLARVNRLLAEALRAQGEDCRLVESAPAPERDGLGAEVMLQNTWPPTPDTLRAPTTGLAGFAWEETGFPWSLVERLNARLHLVTTTSSWVTRTLRANGVTVPTSTVGLGTEHCLAVESEPLPADPGPGFRFLHVSSCLPRKGVDVLLAAWAEAFGPADEVRLIIKATPNPHHDIAAEVAGWRQRHPDAAPVEVYNAEWPEGALRTLYESCQVLVAPSRGEGFGLPLAEAMHHGLAVITTGWGGQCDFCTPDTAWLIDYALVPSRSHVASPGSAWAEPDAGHLAATLRAIRELPAAERRARAAAGAALLRAHFSWPAVARRLRAALDQHRSAPLVPPRLRLAWVSTWNSRCGIAEYSRMLLAAMDRIDARILANTDAAMEAGDDDRVHRCWRADRRDGLAGLARAITDCEPDAVVIQFQFGLFALSALARRIEALSASGVSVFVVFHATRGDVALADHREALARASGLLVHTVADLEHLRRAGLSANAAVLPHGVARPDGREVDPGAGTAVDTGGTEGPVLAAFGFLLPHKGFGELIRAFGRLQGSHPGARLQLFTAVYPTPESEQERERCTGLIAELPEPGAVTLTTRFLAQADVTAALRRADLLVYPYQYTRESASGAVRIGMAADRPVACTPLAIFDDLGAAVHRLPGTGVDDLVIGLEPLLADAARRHARDEARREWLAGHDWSVIGARLRALLHNGVTDAAEGRNGA